MNTSTIQSYADLGVETPVIRPRSSEASGWLNWIQGRLAAIRHLRQRRRAINELARMSDNRLEDLGIPRDRIPEVVEGLIARRGPGFRGSAH